MKLTKNQVFIIKTTIIIMFAVSAGKHANSILTAVEIGPFISPFLYFFFLLICVLIAQWILWSDCLPKWWMLSGFVGCLVSSALVGYLISSAMVGKLSHLSTLNLADRFNIEGVLEYFFAGIITAIPQGFLLKRKGYLWVLLNGIGWALNNAYVAILVYSVFSGFPAYVNILMAATNGLFLGILLSPYLYSILNDQGLNQMKLAE